MTGEHDGHRVGTARPALTRLLAVSPEQFGEQHWGRTPLLSTAAQRHGDEFADLFSLDAADELISRRGLRAPFLRVARSGTTHPDSAFTSGGGIGAGIADQVNDDKVLRLFADGSTLVLQGLHRTWAPLVDFSQQLAADLAHPVQVNAYLTPAQNQGFADHYDVHDVFVLQVHGEKRWLIHDPVHPLPLRDQPWGERTERVRAAAAQPPAVDTVLRPGDCLYLPRGYIHAAQALGGVTAHLTIGVHSWTRHHLAEHLLSSAQRRLSEDESVRGSLPLGVDLSDEAALSHDVEVTREALLRALQEVPATELVGPLRAAARDAQRAAPVNPLAQLSAADQVTRGTVLVVRPHLMLDSSTLDEHTIQIRSRAGVSRMPSAYRTALARLLAGGPVTVADLDADGETAQGAARQFLRAGIALVDR